ncbi:hypothetical protein ACLOJK_019132 [Asimina triloba]
MASPVLIADNPKPRLAASIATDQAATQIGQILVRQHLWQPKMGQHHPIEDPSSLAQIQRTH